MKSVRSVIRLAIWAAFLAYGSLIVLLSHQPGDQEHMKALEHVDKLAHVVEFAIFSILLALTLWTVCEKHIALMVIGGSLLFAISDEIHQSFVPYREASAGDVLADMAGVFVGVLLFTLARARLDREWRRFADKGAQESNSIYGQRQ